MDELNELYKLLFSIFAPLLLVIPIVVLLYSTRHEDREIWSFGKYFRTFDANHGLGSQPLFAIAIVYPIGLFFSTGIWAWNGLTLELSADGFNQFIEISKLPLGLLALSIPLAVLTARLHGTKQTALQISKTEKQISETHQKNKTDLYLAHYKHFCEFLTEKEQFLMLKQYHLNISNNKKLTINKKFCHEVIYPSSSIKDGINEISFAPYDQIINCIEHILKDTINLLSKEKTNILEIRNFFVKSSKEYDQVFNSLFFNQDLKSLFHRAGSFPLERDETCFVSDFYDIYGMSFFLEEQIRSIYDFDKDSIPILKQKFESIMDEYHQALNGKDLDKTQEAIKYLNRELNPISQSNWDLLQDK
jgi:hypothetical protein